MIVNCEYWFCWWAVLILDQWTMAVMMKTGFQWGNEWVNQTRSISLQNDIPPCSSCCWISWMVLTPSQCSALQAGLYPAPPCFFCLRFLMTKCIETIGWTLPSIHQHSEGSLWGSGPQDFRRLTKQLLLTLDWVAAMLFRPTGKSLCRLNEVAWPWQSAHLLTLAPHQPRFPISEAFTIVSAGEMHAFYFVNAD